jgi:hypothetical protein
MVGPGSPVIDGFTIVGGNAVLANDHSGGGVVTYGPVQARIENCTFRANRAAEFGGALQLRTRTAHSSAAARSSGTRPAGKGAAPRRMRSTSRFAS